MKEFAEDGTIHFPFKYPLGGPGRSASGPYKLSYPAGTHQEGKFKNGKLHGMGKMTFPGGGEFHWRSTPFLP